MNSNWFTYRNILSVLGILFGIWFIWKFYIIISYFLIAAVVSLLGRPVVNLLHTIHIGKFYVPRWLSAILALLVIVSVIVGVQMLFIPLIIEQGKVLASIDTQKVAAGLDPWFHRIEHVIMQFQFDQAESQTSLNEILSAQLSKWINMTSISNIFSNLLVSLGGIITAIFSVAFISFFFLSDDKLFYRIVMGITPTRFEEKTKRIMHGSEKTLTRYFGGLIIQSLVVFTLIFIGFWVAGYKYAMLIAFFCALVNIIPYVGPIIGTLFALLVTITSQFSINPEANLGEIIVTIVVICQGVQLIDNYFSQPLIFSNSLNTHPLEIFTIVLIFGSMVGILGMIIAVPAYIFIRIIAREFFSEFKIVRNLTQGMEEM